MTEKDLAKALRPRMRTVLMHLIPAAGDEDAEEKYVSFQPHEVADAVVLELFALEGKRGQQLTNDEEREAFILDVHREAIKARSVEEWILKFQ